MFNNYAALKDAIIGWLDNDDGIPRVDDFIMLCHIRMNRDLKLPQSTCYATFETVANFPWIPLPQLYNGMRRLKLTSGEFGAVTPGDDGYLALTYKPLTAFDQTPVLNTTGRPTSYTIAEQRIRLGPVPDAVYTVETVYNTKVPTLSPAQTTNVFLEEASDLLLYGSLIEASAFIRDPDRLATYVTGYDAGLQALTDNIEQQRFVDGDMAVEAV